MLAKLAIPENPVVKKTNLGAQVLYAITAKIRAISHLVWLHATSFGWLWRINFHFRIHLSKYSPPKNYNQEKIIVTAQCHNKEILRIRIFMVEIIKVDHRAR